MRYLLLFLLSVFFGENAFSSPKVHNKITNNKKMHSKAKDERISKNIKNDDQEAENEDPKISKLKDKISVKIDKLIASDDEKSFRDNQVEICGPGTPLTATIRSDSGILGKDKDWSLLGHVCCQGYKDMPFRDKYSESGFLKNAKHTNNCLRESELDGKVAKFLEQKNNHVSQLARDVRDARESCGVETPKSWEKIIKKTKKVQEKQISHSSKDLKKLVTAKHADDNKVSKTHSSKYKYAADEALKKPVASKHVDDNKRSKTHSSKYRYADDDEEDSDEECEECDEDDSDDEEDEDDSYDEDDSDDEEDEDEEDEDEDDSDDEEDEDDE